MIIRQVMGMYRSRGFKATADAIFRSISSRIGIKIILFDRKKTLNLQKARNIFKNRDIKLSGKGFYYLEPMPTEAELNEYYKNAYWGSFAERDYGVMPRDMHHYFLLIKLFPDFNKTKRNVLNFGAGHGGISIILRFLGHKIVNVEPSEMIEIFSTDYSKVNTISDVPHIDFDLIYGSHSLEHVQDLGSFYEKIMNISKASTIHFWEVPNAEHRFCGVNEGRVDIPHTYYFKEQFFYELFDETIFIKKYDGPNADINEKDGDCIIAIGRINKTHVGSV